MESDLPRRRREEWRMVEGRVVVAGRAAWRKARNSAQTDSCRMQIRRLARGSMQKWILLIIWRRVRVSGRGLAVLRGRAPGSCEEMKLSERRVKRN